MSVTDTEAWLQIFQMRDLYIWLLYIWLHIEKITSWNITVNSQSYAYLCTHTLSIYPSIYLVFERQCLYNVFMHGKGFNRILWLSMDLPLTPHYDVVMFFSSDVAHQAQGSLAPDVCASVWSNQKSAPQQKHFAQRSDDTVPFSGHLVDWSLIFATRCFFFYFTLLLFTS